MIWKDTKTAIGQYLRILANARKCDLKLIPASGGLFRCLTRIENIEIFDKYLRKSYLPSTQANKLHHVKKGIYLDL